MKQANAEWFMAVAFEGKYILTQGIAYLTLTSKGITADLSFDEEGERYLSLTGVISNGSDIHCIAKSADPTVPDFSVKGHTYGDKTSVSIVMTDGTTTLGLCAVK